MPIDLDEFIAPSPQPRTGIDLSEFAPAPPQVDPAVLAQHEEAAKQVLRTKYPKLAQDLDMQQWQSDRHEGEVWRAQQLGQPAPLAPAKPPSAIELLARQPNDPWYKAAANFIPDLVTSAAAPVRQVAQMVGNPHGVKQFDERFQTQELANQMEREKRLNAIPGAETAAGFGEAAIPLAVSAAFPPAAPWVAPLAFGVGFGLPHTARLINEGVDQDQAIARGAAVGLINAAVPGALNFAKPLVKAAPVALKPVVTGAEGMAVGFANNFSDAAAQYPFDPEGAKRTATDLHSPIALGIAGALMPGAVGAYKGVRDRVQAVRETIQSNARERQFRQQFPETAASLDQPSTRQTGDQMVADIDATMAPYVGQELGVTGGIPGMRANPEIGNRTPVAMTPDQIAGQRQVAAPAEPGPLTPDRGIMPEPGPIDPTIGMPRMVQPELSIPEPNMRSVGGELMAGETPASRAQIRDLPPDRVRPDLIPAPRRAVVGPVDPTTGMPELRYPQILPPAPEIRVPGGDVLPPPDRSTPAGRARMQQQPETAVPEANVRTPQGEAQLTPETLAKPAPELVEANMRQPGMTPAETAAARQAETVKSFQDKKALRQAMNRLALVNADPVLRQENAVRATGKRLPEKTTPEVPSVPEESLFKDPEVQRAETPSPRPVDNPVATPERAPVEAPRPVEPEAAPAPPVEPVKPAPVETTPAPAATVAETPVKPTVKHAEWVRSYRKAEGKNAQRAFRVDQETLDSTAGTKGAEIVHDPMTGEVLVRDGIAPETAGQAAKGLPEAVDLSKHTVEVEGQRVNAHEVVSHLSDTLAGLRRLLDCLKG